MLQVEFAPSNEAIIFVRASYCGVCCNITHNFFQRGIGATDTQYVRHVIYHKFKFDYGSTLCEPEPTQ